MIKWTWWNIHIVLQKQTLKKNQVLTVIMTFYFEWQEEIWTLEFWHLKQNCVYEWFIKATGGGVGGSGGSKNKISSFWKISWRCKDKTLSQHVRNSEICCLLRQIAKFAEFCEIPRNFSFTFYCIISRNFHHYFECHLCSSKFEQFLHNQTSCYQSRPDDIKSRPVIIKTDQMLQK